MHIIMGAIAMRIFSCRRNGRAFTLIELLIVIAIIAILALIAIPNFLEAQTRSKITRCKADMRTYKTALEAYQVDNNAYPPDKGGTTENIDWCRLTTPVAYITSVLLTPWKASNFPQTGTGMADPYNYGTWNGGLMSGPGSLAYIIGACGPDNYNDWLATSSIDWIGLDCYKANLELIYDPTNGTISKGDILATNKQFLGR